METCKSCRFWQGTKYSQWADCNNVIAVLQPDLLKVKKYIDDDVWYYFKIPFDPHETKYWGYNLEFIDLHRGVTQKMQLPEGVKREVNRERDIWIDQFGNERTKTTKVCYFRTHETFNCEYWEKICQK